MACAMCDARLTKRPLPFSLSGSYFFGVAPPPTPIAVVASGVITATSGGTVNATADLSGPLGLAYGQQTSGTGLVFSPQEVSTDSLGDIGYAISPGKAVSMNSTSVQPEVAVIAH